MRTPRTGIAQPRKTPKGASDQALIRELFAERTASYGYSDVLRLTRSTEAELLAAIAEGELEPVRGETTLHFAWEDVAVLALRRWTPRVIAHALGPLRAHALPFLNDLQTIVVRLPRYQVQLLQLFAAEQGAGYRHRLTVSDVLEQHLLDLASGFDLAAMERAIPGFTAALHFPDRRWSGRRGRSEPT
ncbi:MAG TPA: hypothetical protein VJZ76_03475 [Thermoanaerobaculia bacterium]|nr:hypothetical protein [Thermoanaerobaculia bacterium]